ncbi:MAG: ATP-dependent DNA helicase RecG [Clostridia bacterium]|nr:ATP-dependent DNA helicase RecG [Clostridia bacterium]
MARLTSDTPVSELNGVGKVRATQLAKLGIATVGDLIYYFPRAYEKRGEIRPLREFDTDRCCSYLLTVSTEVRNANIKRGLTISKFRAVDNTGSIEITFFNSPYVKDVFHIGSTFRFWGKASLSKNKLQMTNPKFEPYVDGLSLPDFVPIYPLTDGLSSKQIDKLIKNAINDILPDIIDPIPDNIRLDNSLPTLTYAIKNAHFPDNDEALLKAQRRLAFDEMLYFGMGISMSASQKIKSDGIKLSPCSLSPLTDLLPYELTGAQKQAINDIYRDCVIGKDGRVSPMARIIVGDVGCGKTICALAAAYITAKSKYQTALMVPTEILARQHYAELSRLLGALDIKVELLLGSTSQKEKRRIKDGLASGEIDVVVGTHALISDNVSFASLALVVTDEQHRFGVGQRAKLKEKSSHAHLLVMSATPIPRTLALTMYGDLDISRINEMPAGRQRVDTFVVDEGYRLRLNDFIRKQVSLGGQCYIVCPAIEANNDEEEFVVDYATGEVISENSLNLKSAVELANELSATLPDISIGLLHGKMKSAEKDAVMSSFASGETKLLVSTTVIEVGVNVPNACLMIVENAERFGLAQLHQLRGRVGRGKRKSYCVLVSDINSPKSKERLEVMRTTYDGFEIAEKDLVLRGPGDFFSSVSDDNLRQSGGFEFRYASMCDSTELLTAAFSAAKAIIESDPGLENPSHQNLKKEIDRRIHIASSTIS